MGEEKKPRELYQLVAFDKNNIEYLLINDQNLSEKISADVKIDAFEYVRC